MALVTEFREIPLESLHREASIMKIEGWRFIQTHAANGENGVDLYYSFMKDGKIENLKITGVTKDDPVPSVTDLFLAGFVFENEARELFGVDMHDIAIDFHGGLYAPAEAEPMTFITPEQKAAREKAQKALAAKKAKEAKAADGSAASTEAASADADQAPVATADASAPRVFVMTPERRARLDAKMEGMAPEKIAKIEAALKAREAEAAAASSGATQSAKPETAAAEKPAEAAASAEAVAVEAQPEKKVDTKLESALSLMDGEKAAKVRAIMAQRAGEPAAAAQACAEAAPQQKLDEEIESKLALMDSDKAEKIRKAMAARSAQTASLKGGE